MAATKGGPAQNHACLRRDWDQAFAAFLVLHETGGESRAHLWLRGLDASAASRRPAETRGGARGGEVEAAKFRHRERPLSSGLMQNRKVAISGTRQGSDHGCNTNKGVNQS